MHCRRILYQLSYQGSPFSSLFTFNFCHFNYNVSWCVPLWVNSVWDSLCFLDLGDHFLPQIRKLLTLMPPIIWNSYSANITALDVVPEVSCVSAKSLWYVQVFVQDPMDCNPPSWSLFPSILFSFFFQQ